MSDSYVVDAARAAAMLGLTPNGTRQLYYRGHLPGFKLGRFLRFLREDVERLHRDGWPNRQWGKVLNAYEVGLHRAELHRAAVRRWRARR